MTSSIINVVINISITSYINIYMISISEYWEWIPISIIGRIIIPIPARIIRTVIGYPKGGIDNGCMNINGLIDIIGSIHIYITYNLNLHFVIAISLNFN